MQHRKFLRQTAFYFFSPYRCFCSFSSPFSGCSRQFIHPGGIVMRARPLDPQHPTFQNYLDIFFPSLAASSVPRTFAVSLLNSIKIASA